MTSVAKMIKRPRGFTLIEIVMVLAIATVVMGGVMGMMVYSSAEHQLRNASGEIELLAKRARMTAIVQQTPYALEFREGLVRMLPLALAGRDEKKTAGGHHIGGEPVISVGESHQYTFKRDMKVAIRHWNSNAWLPALKNNIQIWRFDPTGLCEPISVKLTLGDSWAEDTYHPLTASIRESLLEAQ